MNKFIKRFNEWIPVKIHLDNRQHQPPFFNEREVWWCSMGENVGVEISGKGAYFTRPVIIFKKLDAFSFIGIALTKTDRSGDRYEKIIISGVTNTVLLAHIHNYDYRRLDKQITILSESDFEMIRQAFIKFISE